MRNLHPALSTPAADLVLVDLAEFDSATTQRWSLASADYTPGALLPSDERLHYTDAERAWFRSSAREGMRF